MKFFDLDFEVILTAFMLGSAIIQGIVEGSLRIFFLFFIPCVILLIMQYRRTVGRIKETLSDAPKHSMADVKRAKVKSK